MHISYFIFKLASRQEKLPLTSEKQITSPRSRNQRYAAKNRTGRNPVGNIREQMTEKLI